MNAARSEPAPAGAEAYPHPVARSPVSRAMREGRFRFFFADVPGKARILEVGGGDGWLGERLRREGWTTYTSVSLDPPADIVGDIRDWRRLGLEPASFDAIAAFEVVEHVACFPELAALLKDDGRLFVTTPLPAMDWACRLLEALRINQRRTSPHDHLVDLRRVKEFEIERYRLVASINQWAVMRKRRDT